MQTLPGLPAAQASYEAMQRAFIELKAEQSSDPGLQQIIGGIQANCRHLLHAASTDRPSRVKSTSSNAPDGRRWTQVLLELDQSLKQQYAQAQPDGDLELHLRRQLLQTEHIRSIIEDFYTNAATVLNYQQHTIDKRNERVVKELGGGIALVVVGLVLTGITYLLGGAGGTFVVFWGAVAVGAIMIFRSIGLRQGWW